jgi:hypothetical protein
MRAIFLRCLAIGTALLCAACGAIAPTYEVVRGVDAEMFKRDYAKCTTEWGGYLFTYGENPLDPTTLFQKCMQAHGYNMHWEAPPGYGQ